MRIIKVSYLIIFISLLFWATFAFVTMNQQIANQQVYAKLINISGKQRMLSQKTALIAKRIFETKDPQLIIHFDFLTTLMKKDHAFLLKNTSSQHIKDIYLQTPYNLDKNVKIYFQLLDSFHIKNDLQTVEKIEEYSFSLLEKLNYVVNEFEKESDLSTKELQNRELLIFIGTILTLILEIVFIILPTIREIDQTKKNMEHFNTLLKKRVEEQKKKILKANEIKKEQEKILIEQEKQASMAEMIGNIAHQWRQPLSVISTCASGMKVEKEYGLLKDEKFYSMCDTIDDASQFLSKTISDFANLVANEKVKVKFNLKKELDNILNLFSETIKDNEINIDTNIPLDIEIFGNKNDLAQVILNILTNSKDAIIANKVSCKNISLDVVPQKESVLIFIKDNGGGIPKEIVNKIFDPYFTTKHKSQGTGLGLNMSYNLVVNNMQGTIKTENIEYTHQNILYKGTKFEIALPL